MPSCYLDSNLLVYFKDETSPNHQQAKNLINKLVLNNYSIYISSLVIDELLYVLSFLLKENNKDVNLKEELGSVLKDILDIPGLDIINPPNTKKAQIKVINLIFKYSLQPRDAYHLLTMIENKISYLSTFDTDFDRVFAEKKAKKFK